MDDSFLLSVAVFFGLWAFALAVWRLLLRPMRENWRAERARRRRVKTEWWWRIYY